MNISNILGELDRLFYEKKFMEVEPFLLHQLKEAQTLRNDSAIITLTNEIIGFYRDTSQYDKSIYYCDQILPFMETLGLKDTLHYATTLLNVANAYRACGKLEESLSFYHNVIRLYDILLESKSDFLYASYYNNISLLYQELGYFQKAAECLNEALKIVKQYPNAQVELATTYTNLGASLLKYDRVDEAIQNLSIAFSIFEKQEVKDFHYSGALSAMGEALYQRGDYEASVIFYERALKEIKANVGETTAYYITENNLKKVYEKIENLPSNGMALCKRFFEKYGKPMLREKFPQYIDKIAVGLVGEGSECFGFDDELSRDHDFGPGFCMWLSKETYDKIGKELQEEYEKLPKSYRGITRKITHQGKHRVGVFEIGAFYEMLIGRTDAPKTELDFMVIPENRLATAVNGEVFYDDEGIFSAIRAGIKAYYPETLWRKKIAQAAATISQSGQYNYERMTKRGDLIASQLALAEFVTATMQMVYLLNRTYAPFYKWMHKGLAKLPILSEISELLKEQCNADFDEKQALIENIAAMIIRELNVQGLSNHADSYLEHHTPVILNGPPSEQIVRLEWEAFDKTKNEGGRADCQDDYETFYIMRKSQYLTWTDELIESYMDDFKNAEAQGRNLISEKYAWMMESTSPEAFSKLKDKLPFISAETKSIIEGIVQVQVNWMEEFANRYPNMAGNARSIHTAEDTRFNTSYETYLRGELKTYSDRTLYLYGQFIVSLAREEKNLATMIMKNTALLYGYRSLNAAEMHIS